MGSCDRKYNGHAGLGAELRRLRGGRTLQQVADLSRTPPLAERIKSVAAPTLSLIENGIALPSLDTLYTLSVLYKVPMQRLYEIVGLDRLVAAIDVPGTAAEVKAAQRQAWQEERWHDALALSVHGERREESPGRRLAWRISRGTCLAKVGMAVEGVRVLQECAESPELPPERRPVLYHDLAVVHLAAGQPRAAVMAAREARRLLPPDATAELRWSVEAGVVGAQLAVAEYGLPCHERDVADALIEIQRALREPAVASGPQGLSWRLFEAIARRFEGNAPLAGRSFTEVARAAAAEGLLDIELGAWLHLGAMRRRDGRFEEAARVLRRAEGLAETLRNPQLIFDVAVELLLLALGQGDRRAASVLHRRCERHFPFVGARSPSVVLFEQRAWEVTG